MTLREPETSSKVRQPVNLTGRRPSVSYRSYAVLASKRIFTAEIAENAEFFRSRSAFTAYSAVKEMASVWTTV